MEETIRERDPLFTRRMLARLIWPLVVEQLLAVTIGMADTMMVSSVGEAAVSGISLVDSINILFIQIFSALATGGAVVASHYLGRKQPEQACDAAKQLLYAITAFALVLMTVSLLFKRQLLRLVFGSIDSDVMRNAETYFWLSAVSYPFLAIYNGCAALYRSMNNSRVSMLTSLFMNAVNIGGNAVLIYGFRWGVAGAATASLVSRALSAGIMLVLIRSPKNSIRVASFKPKLQLGMVKRILRIGIPNGVENGMFQIGKLMVQGLIATLGTSAIAANAIAGNIASMSNVPGAAIGLAMITVVGQCVGAGEYRQAERYTLRLLGLVYLVMGAICLTLLFAAEPLVGLFNLSLTAKDMAVEVIQMCMLASALFWPLSFTTPNALRAAGDAKFTMVVSMVSMLVLRIGFSYLLVMVFELGLNGVWIAMYIDWILRASVFTVRFLWGRWKKKKVV